MQRHKHTCTGTHVHTPATRGESSCWGKREMKEDGNKNHYFFSKTNLVGISGSWTGSTYNLDKNHKEK